MSNQDPDDYERFVDVSNDATEKVVRVLERILDSGEARAFSSPALTALGERLCRLHLFEAGKLRVWMAVSDGREHYVISDAPDNCDGYLDEYMDVHPDDGLYWSVVDDKKKISICLDEDGSICGICDGTPVELPAWVWAAKLGVPGHLCSTE